MFTIKKCLIFLFFSFLGTYAFAQTNISGIINDYAIVTQLSCNSVTVNNAAAFSAGDKALLIQMKGAQIDTTSGPAFGSVSNYNGAGNYEYVEIVSVAGTTITFTKNIKQIYVPAGHVQLIRIPVYANANVIATLTAQAWNGSTGGVLALEVTGTLTLQANMDVSGLGFKGGRTSINVFGPCGEMSYYYDTLSGYAAQKGEGIADIPAPILYAGRGAWANGGGGGNEHNAGGGGGGNTVVGGIGGWEYNQCSYTNHVNGLPGWNLNGSKCRLFLGGGGGGGHQNDNFGLGGTNGGGIIFIKASIITGNGNSIITNGVDQTATAGNDAAGGAGAGGSIWLEVNSYTGNVSFIANGGKGGDIGDAVCHGPGGGGAGGQIYSSITLPGTVTIVQNGGLPGIHTVAGACFNDSYGATAGANGKTDIVTIIKDTLFAIPKNLTCYHSNDGSIDLTVLSNCENQFQYAWTNAAITEDITNIPAGTYTVTVTYPNGCTYTTSAIVTEPSQLIASATSSNAACGQNNGSALASATGAKTPYTYSWINQSITGTSITGLGAGNYCVQVTDSAGCMDTACVLIAAPGSLSIALDINPAKCFNSCDGSTTIMASGGTTPYTYSWSNGATTISSTALCASVYSITVTDAGGCTGDTSFTITQPIALSLQGNSVNTKCYQSCDGTASVLSSGGTSPYTYLWNTTATTAAANGLCAGNYTATISDINGCTKDTSFTISQPTPINKSFTKTDVQCFNECDGSANVTTSGGASPYNYSWNNGTSTPFASALCAGNYTVTITDNNNCTSDTVVIISQPLVLSNIIVAANSNCGQANGTASVTVSGGLSPYTYSWSASGGSQTTATATGLVSANYCVNITDANGCTQSACVQVIDLNGITAQIQNIKHPSCFNSCDGTAGITVSGGTTPYIYSWNNGLTSTSSSQLCNGSYCIAVSDANGCLDSVCVSLTQPSQVQSSNPAPQAMCIGKTATLNVNASGGTSPYTYTWAASTGGTQTGSSISYTGTATISYTITVNDANNCSATSTTSVTINPDPIVVITASDTMGCDPYCVKFTEYVSPASSSCLWNFGDGSTSTVCSAAHCYSSIGTFDVSLSVTDINGCTASISKPGWIQIWGSPVAGFSVEPNPLSSYSPQADITDASQNALNWIYDFGDGTTPINGTLANPSHLYSDEDSTSFIITQIVQSSNGCADTAYVTVSIVPEVSFYVPNTFTPNGDGTNDLFFGTGIGIIEKEMWIYDRWGNEIAHITDLSGGWNGKVQDGSSNEVSQIDTYVWVIRYRDIFNTQRKLTGHVNIVK